MPVPTFCRAPLHMRYNRESYFEPRFVSIGPLYHEKMMEQRVMKKAKDKCISYFTRELQTNTTSDPLDYLVQNIIDDDMKHHIHQWYGKNFVCSENFFRMLVRDGCFIIRIILAFSREGEESMFYPGVDIKTVRFDLLLMENQIPFFFIRKVYYFLRNKKMLPPVQSSENCRSNSQENGMTQSPKDNTYMCCLPIRKQSNISESTTGQTYSHGPQPTPSPEQSQNNEAQYPLSQERNHSHEPQTTLSQEQSQNNRSQYNLSQGQSHGPQPTLSPEQSQNNGSHNALSPGHSQSHRPQPTPSQEQSPNNRSHNTLSPGHSQSHGPQPTPSQEQSPNNGSHNTLSPGHSQSHRPQPTPSQEQSPNNRSHNTLSPGHSQSHGPQPTPSQEQSPNNGSHNTLSPGHSQSHRPQPTPSQEQSPNNGSHNTLSPGHSQSHGPQPTPSQEQSPNNGSHNTLSPGHSQSHRPQPTISQEQSQNNGSQNTLSPGHSQSHGPQPTLSQEQSQNNRSQNTLSPCHSQSHEPQLSLMSKARITDHKTLSPGHRQCHGPQPTLYPEQSQNNGPQLTHSPMPNQNHRQQSSLSLGQIQSHRTQPTLSQEQSQNNILHFTLSPEQSQSHRHQHIFPSEQSPNHRPQLSVGSLLSSQSSPAPTTILSDDVFLKELKPFIWLDMPWQFYEYAEFTEPKHLLDLYWKWCIPPLKNSPASNLLEDDGVHASWVKMHLRSNAPKKIKSAYELYRKAGVTFQKIEHEDGFDVKFQKGILQIPHLQLDPNQTTLLANLVAFEEFKPSKERLLTSYVLLLDGLINTEKDVELLQRHGVITNKLYSSQLTASIYFNDIGNVCSVDYNDHFCQEKFDDLNSYYRSKWNNRFAKLRHKYFNSPWAIISFSAGATLIIFSGLQTVYNLLRYYQHR